MRTKPDVDTLSIDDLYNNLRVFKQELTSTSKSSASAQNVAFVSHSKSSTNKVKSGHIGAYSTYTPTSSNNIQEREVPVGFTDEVIYLLFAKQYEDLDLLHKDLEQIDDVDIEEMDINWQIAMIAIRMKNFYKKTGRRVRIDGNKPIGFDKRCLNVSNVTTLKEQYQNYLLTIDDGVVNWGEHTVEEEETNHALMAISSNTELGEQEVKILAYTLAVKKLEAQIVTFQKQQLSLNEQLTFQANEIYAKDEKLKRYRRIGMKAVKEKEQLQKTGPQKPEISDSDDNSTKHSTCQSNDSEGSFGNPSEHSSESESESISVPNEMSASKSVITNEKVVSESKEVEPSCATHVKTPRQQMKNQGTSEVKGKNWNKMMERELGEVQLNAGRPNINSVRPNINTGRTNVNSVRPNINSVRPNINSVRQNVNSVRTNINTVRSKQPVPTNNTNSFSPVRPQGNWGTAVKTSVGYNWRRPRTKSNYNSGSNLVRTDHPLKNLEDRGIFDSGCSGHMTGNKDHLDDFEECKGGSVTFGGSKGYITSKGRIRVGNLDFDSVSFVKELGHFNLFSISQICDKKHKVLFTETEYFVVSPDFKMPDENQILFNVPRQNNLYSFDMKTPGLTKNYACLIAKATSDESKLWHRRFSWVFFLATNDETSGILQNFIRQIENQLNHRVIIIRSDNGTEFKNRDMLEFYTLSMLGKFDGKCDEGFLVGYSLNSKAFRVYNLVTKKVEVNLHVQFLEEKPNVEGVGTLQTPNANASEEEDEAEELIVVPTVAKHTATKVGPRKSSTNSKAEESLTELQNLKTQEKGAYPTSISNDTPKILAFRRELDELAQKHLREVPKNKATSTTSVNSGSGLVNTQHADQDDSDMPELIIFTKPQKGIFNEAFYDDDRMVHDFNNLPTEVAVSPIPTLRIHNIHLQSQILGDPKSVQTRSRVQQHSGAYALVSDVQKQQRNNHKDQHHCLFACFLSQEEPKNISEALTDNSWVEAIQEELLQFRL
ncbi:ribonuclease H-like domain-containing protein [Tanacetum coccineum]